MSTCFMWGYLLVPFCAAVAVLRASELYLEVWSHWLLLLPRCEILPHPVEVARQHGVGGRGENELRWGGGSHTSLCVSSCFSVSRCSMCSSLSEFNVWINKSATQYVNKQTNINKQRWNHHLLPDYLHICNWFWRAMQAAAWENPPRDDY